jgi:hypothetical protein
VHKEFCLILVQVRSCFEYIEVMCLIKSLPSSKPIPQKFPRTLHTKSRKHSRGSEGVPSLKCVEVPTLGVEGFRNLLLRITLL